VLDCFHGGVQQVDCTWLWRWAPLVSSADVVCSLVGARPRSSGMRAAPLRAQAPSGPSRSTRDGRDNVWVGTLRVTSSRAVCRNEPCATPKEGKAAHSRFTRGAQHRRREKQPTAASPGARLRRWPDGPAALSGSNLSFLSLAQPQSPARTDFKARKIRPPRNENFLRFVSARLAAAR
jgi:hypothetical protein